MIRSIFSTAGTLGIISITNLVMVLLVSNELGKAGVTTMGLIVLGISFIVMISNIVGGATLVYAVPRWSIKSILIISYGWATLSTFIMGGILFFLELAPPHFIWWTIALGFIECLFTINNQVLMGKKEIKNYNITRLIQKIGLLVLFISMGITLENYVFSMLISSIIAYGYSMILVNKHQKTATNEALMPLTKKLFGYGLQDQSSNIVQLLNYRLVYIFIEKSMGEVLGIYIVAVQLAESLWIPSKALATIQYSTLANETNRNIQQKLSLDFLKLSFLITSVLLIILLFIPESFIGDIFGKDFTGSKEIVFTLSIGVLSIACYSMFNHYFSSIGIFKYNLYASLVGLVIVASLGWWFVDSYKLAGAGMVSSIAYLATTLVMGWLFFSKTNIKLIDFFSWKINLKKITSK